MDLLENQKFPYSGGQAMTRLMRQAIEFLRNEDGPTSVEYAVMLALIVVVCVVSITNLGTKTSTTFSTVGAKMAGS